MSKQATLVKEDIHTVVEKIEEQMKKVIVGQEWMVRRLLIGLFAKIPYSFKRGEEEKAGCGHILLEGVPGLAKTLAVMTLANTISAKFQRIQFTPDLLPADIIGTKVFDIGTNAFRTEKGPIFAHIVLADEINRATPKTQSALLEAMQERQVTIGEVSYPLETLFWVLATQNPLEQEGVYTLPEAQVDRFAMKVVIKYPTLEKEMEILNIRLEQVVIHPIVTPADVVRIRDVINGIYVGQRVHQYIVWVGRATRNIDGSALPVVRDMVLHGASPRSYQHLLALTKVAAFLAGRDYVLPDDVKSIAVDAMQHRIIRSVRAEAEGISPADIVQEILDHVPIP
ncbi:MAG: AAA family ATPase [Acidobacteria bacterium]|nr:AAA family ATPase [Acidobacteriota bacterium]